MDTELMAHLKDYAAAQTVKGQIYLRLGRKHADRQDLSGCAAMIGPLAGCYICPFFAAVTLTFLDGYETGPCKITDGFGLGENLFFYNGEYYGDWGVVIADR